MPTHLVLYLGAAFLLTITPGPDTALVTRVALGAGNPAARRTIVGIITGLMVWGVLAAVGVAALLAASAPVFTVLKLCGAAYLFWLGAQAFWSTRHNQAHRDVQVQPGAYTSPYRQGLLSNLLNPKVGVFYTTFLPQFIPPHVSVVMAYLFLAGILTVMTLIWLLSYARMVVRMGDVLQRPRVRNMLQRITGAVLIAFGLRLATQQR